MFSINILKNFIKLNNKNFTRNMTSNFQSRHLGNNKLETNKMLEYLNLKNEEELIKKVIPSHIINSNIIEDINKGISEEDALKYIKNISKKNKININMIGMGYYPTITPNVLLRNLIENPSWYTPYTPYQSEISQGRMEMLLNFQTFVSELNGMPISNCSLLDESSSASEAAALCDKLYKKKRNKVFVSNTCHPQNIECIRTRMNALNIELEIGNENNIQNHSEYSSVIVQYPDTYGYINNYDNLVNNLKENDTKFVVITDLLACTLIKPPYELGADIVVGSTQRFGVPMFNGGPHAAFMSVKDEYKRLLPGRLIGETIDKYGNKALRMALQTREQYIKREKATSNICTAQSLLANLAASYSIYHGPDGLKKIAKEINDKANFLYMNLKNNDINVLHSNFFDTLTIEHYYSDKIYKKLCDENIFVRRYPNNNNLLSISIDETTDYKIIYTISQCFGAYNSILDMKNIKYISNIPDNMTRTTKFMQQKIFNTYQTETKMMRYLKTLEKKDISLTDSMIPLGSCTMKLNAASEMIPVSWEEFANIHPFSPSSQREGYTQLINELERFLEKITGFSKISSQPNSGAMGEYAGLLAIKKYNESKNSSEKNICLIPLSAHGTNGSSATMCGFKVVGIKTNKNGEINIEDLKSKIKKYENKVGAIMITYPSTYGVFDSNVKDVINEVHSSGGQVYMDGANMNAQVGFCSPYSIGADVCHLNLHKTFCIPHGGGGPGVGSIGVAKHLVDFLPGHCLVDDLKNKDGQIASAPFGNAGILPISWMYIKMMGRNGLKKSTEMALLNSNYMARKLEEGGYNILYKNENGFCAHEFILDLRSYKKYNITEEDFSKRLIDYGFHAPTTSWPVPGTIMVEPTESENIVEIDNYITSLLMIKDEIQDIIDNNRSLKNNIIKNSPHTHFDIISNEWDNYYSREKATFPLKQYGLFPNSYNNKFWPTVNRINNAYGDKNLVCSCPTIEEIAE